MTDNGNVEKQKNKRERLKLKIVNFSAVHENCIKREQLRERQDKLKTQKRDTDLSNKCLLDFI